MAGLLYTFRLFVYNVENLQDTGRCELLQVMQRRLYRAICVPAMFATVITGVLLITIVPGYLNQPWFHIKGTLLVFLLGYHFYCNKVRIDLVHQRCKLSSKQCRMINEIPTLLMIAIVILVVVKPFGH